MKARVTIAGIAIDVCGPAWIAPHLERLGPFLDAAPHRRRIALHLDTFETPPPPAGSEIYRRPELVFGEDAGGLWTRMDASEGSFEAALQLSLEAALLFDSGLVVHASAGVVDGGAWLMPGVSGTGKSTAARNAGFETVLCDEMCIVRCVEGPAGSTLQVAGTPFWSADRPLPLCTVEAPLTVLARLVQSTTVGASPMGASEAVAWFMGCVTLYRHDAQARTAAFETACAIVEAAQCVSLEFPKEGPWLTAAQADVLAASSPKL